MKTNIFEDDHLICYLEDSLPVLYHRWLRKPSGQEFREGLIRIQKIYLQISKQHPNLLWLANTELLSELDETEEEWLTSEWDKLLFDEAGVKVHAVVLGDDLFADYPMEKFKMSSDEKFKLKNVRLGVFPNEDEAYRWLEEKKNEISSS